MKIFLTEKQKGRLLVSLKKIKKELAIVISIRGNVLETSGDSLEEYDAGSVIDAIIQGFPFKEALALKNSDYMFERVDMKTYLRKQRFRQIKARIIGKEGKAIKTLRQLSNCDIRINDYSIFILGLSEDVEIAKEAVMRLIRGSKHSSVYSKLEHRPSFEDDLGLKSG